MQESTNLTLYRLPVNSFTAMKIRTLTSVRSIVDTVGRQRLQLLTGKGSSHITNWIATGFFPPTTFVVINAELERIACRAPEKLWRMIPAVRPRARAA